MKPAVTVAIALSACAHAAAKEPALEAPGPPPAPQAGAPGMKPECDRFAQEGGAARAASCCHTARGEVHAGKRGPGNAVYLRACTLACNGGDGPSCGWQGFLQLNGLGAGRSEPLAREAYRRGCSLSEAECCNDLGGLSLKGDVLAGIEAFRQACTLGSSSACSNLGLVLQLAPPPEGNADEGRFICEQQRARGFGNACSEPLRKLIEQKMPPRR